LQIACRAVVHHLAFRQEAVAHQPLATLIVQKVCVLSHEPGYLGKNSRPEKLACTGLDDLGQRVR